MEKHMAEENKKQEVEKEKKEERKEVAETKIEEKKEDKKAEEEKEIKKLTKKEKPKKSEAIAKGKDMGISTKHSIAICRYIKGKKIEQAVEDLEKVLAFKKAIPMRGEIPHRKNVYGKGKIGRYPVKACEVFIKLLKSLAANSSVNGLDNAYIFTAKADKASRPYKRARQRFKRTNVLLVAKEQIVKENKEKKEKK